MYKIKLALLRFEDIKNLIMWGNHSTTQVPDFTNIEIKGKNIKEFIKDKN